MEAGRHQEGDEEEPARLTPLGVGSRMGDNDVF
jgi:hypothetical protein